MTWTSGGRSRTSEPSWRKLRLVILERDGHRCTHEDEDGRCTAPATTVDHVVSVAKGGTDDPSNLRSLCQPHHDRKSSAERNAARWAPERRRNRPSKPHPGLRPDPNSS